MHRLGDQPVAFVPLAGPAVQLGQQLGFRQAQAMLQQVRKKPMIAIPVSFVIQRDDEQIGSLQPL
jgi:hypothetical protein